MVARREERIEGLTPDLGAHAGTIVGKQNFDAVLPGCAHLDGDGTFLAVRKSVQDRIEDEDRQQLSARSGITVYQQIGLALDVERQIALSQAWPETREDLPREIAEVKGALIGKNSIVAI